MRQILKIDEQFRRQIPKERSIHDLPAGVKQNIYRRISEWAVARNVDLESIYLDRRRRPPGSRVGHRMLATNALQRLIEAQEPEIRRIQVPGDIVLIPMYLE